MKNGQQNSCLIKRERRCYYERIPHGRYSKELRIEAVKHVIEKGLSIPEASRCLDVPKSTLNYWVKSSKEGNLGSIGINRREPSDVGLGWSSSSADEN
ncbi:transposase [Desulforhopalus sp. 52FAK]